jgi:hypothetical protein
LASFFFKRRCNCLLLLVSCAEFPLYSLEESELFLLLP